MKFTPNLLRICFQRQKKTEFTFSVKKTEFTFSVKKNRIS